jgi:hypothetical protein
MNTSKYKQKNMQHQRHNINDEEYKRLSEFKYLFSLDYYDNDCEKKFERVIAAENRDYQAL